MESRLGKGPRFVVSVFVFALAGAAVLAPTVLAQSVITTLAGTDNIFTGDGQPALNAGLGLVTGIAVDHNGNIYFNDPDNHVVFRVGTDGIIHVIAGNGIGGYSGDGGPATDASIGGDETNFDLGLSAPILNGIAVDSNGNVFITTGQVIRRIDTNGIITTYAGGGANFPGDGEQAVNANLGNLLGITIDASNNVFVVDRSHAMVRKVTPDGIISTVAGTGTNGFTGDGGSAASAQLNNPIAIASDAQGNLYIVEQMPGRVRKITIGDGTIHTIAGGGTLAPGKGVPPLSVNIDVPRAVAVTAAGDIYTFAPFNGIFIKFAANGDSSYVSSNLRNNLFLADNVPASQIFISGQAFSNSSLAVDSAGNVYTSQDIRGLVRKIDTNGILTTIAGNDQYRYSPDGNPAVSAQVRNPMYITVGSDGSTLYFLSTNGMRKIGSDGILNTATTQPPFQAPFLIGLSADSAGGLYSITFNQVVRLAPDGSVQKIVNVGAKPGSGGDQGPAAQAQLNLPHGLAVDKSGNLFIADTGNNKVRKVNAAGVITTIAGTGQSGHTGDGGPALNATFSNLGGMLADNQGGVYVIDGVYIRHILANGTVQAVAGNGVLGFSGDGGKAVDAAISVEFRSGMVLDAAGNLYFSGSDFENHIRRIAPDDTITTVAGTGIHGGFGGDGGPATKALFNEPLGLAMDSAGNLYIADSGNNRIRIILANPPVATATPAQFTFVGNAAAAPPLAQYLTVIGSIGKVPFTITQSSGSDWLTLSTSNGVTPRLIQLVADPSALTSNTYNATLMVQAGTAAPIPVTVSFVVGPGLPPKLSVDKSRLSFTYPLNSTAIVELVSVGNSGGGSIAFQATAQTAAGGNWLSVTPGSGSVTPTENAILQIRADPAGLNPGTYRGTITISSTGGADSQTVQVTMTVSRATQAIRLSHAGLTFTSVQNGGIAPPQTFAVLNIGSGAMNWTAGATTLSGGSWLTVSPSSGSSVSGSPPPKVTVSVNQSGLAPGRYYGLVRIRAPGAANTPHVITILLRVLPSSTDIGAVLRPNELVFVATEGDASPSSKSVLAYNIAAIPKTYTSSVFMGGANFSYLPGQATLALDSPTEIVVQPVTDGLTHGVYHGHLTLQFSDGRVRDVKLHLVVKRAAAGSTAVSASIRRAQASGPCSPSKLIPTLNSIGQSFTVPAGWPVALQASVVDDCGDPLDNGSVVVSFSNGDPPLSLLSLHSAGEWQATWSPGNRQSNQLTLTVNAEAAQPVLQGSTEITGGFNATSDAPQLSGIVSGASFAPGVPIAPGAIVSLFGSQLADATGSASGLPLPGTIQGASVEIAGESSPLFYTSTGQLNAAIPLDIAPNTSQQMLVIRDTTISVPLAVDVAPTQPAVFLSPKPGAANQGAIFAVRKTSSGQNTFLAQPASPATVGDVLVIYCDGLGAVNHTPAPGAASPGSPPATTTDTPTVTIGGKPASVAFSGLTPGLVGVYQINAAMPSGIATGNQVPVVVSISGQDSPAATIAVK